MSNLVIVAIPAADDIVWKVSSEKVPHLTLLFLGELEPDDNVQRMADFIEHAVEVSEHGPFYLEVDYRDTLGPDDADVLFFKDNSSTKWINSFRGQLLQQNDIRAEYEEAEAAGLQYPEWNPHLTLGYPSAPAKEIPDNRSIYSVAFDRIALWTTDFDGPTFRLEWPERDSSAYPALIYSDVGKSAVADILSHHGIKGMKWGGTKTTSVSVGGKTKMVTAKKAAKLDKKWQKNQFTLGKGIERHNAMADHFNGRIGALNDKYHKDDFSKEAHDEPAKWSPRYKQYNKEVNDLHARSFQHAVEQVHGTSPTGKLKMDVIRTNDGDGMQMVVKNVGQAQHAATVETDDEVFLFKVIRDPSGLITSIAPANDLDEGGEDALEQTATRGEDFVLSHQSALDDPTVKDQIKAKLQDILEDVTTDDDGDYKLFGDPLIIAKLQSVLSSFYSAGIDKSVAYDALGEVFLEHFGIKGMKWGRSKGGAPTAVEPHATSRIPHGAKRKTKIDVEGGENHPAHADAIHVAKAQAKLKKSGAKALSNQELRDVATRVQLENHVSMLTGHKGKQFVSRHLKGGGEDLARQGVRTGIRKTATKVGVAALV